MDLIENSRGGGSGCDHKKVGPYQLGGVSHGPKYFPLPRMGFPLGWQAGLFLQGSHLVSFYQQQQQPPLIRIRDSREEGVA